MRAKDKVAVFCQVIGWATILLSIALYLLFWRVEYEPGAMKIPEILQASQAFLITGGLAFAGGNVYLLIRKAWKIYRVAWTLCGLILLLAILCSPALLVLLV